MAFVKTVKRLAAGAAAAFITVSSMPAGSFTAFAEAIPSNPQPPSGGELIYSVDPFDAEHSAGYFCVKDSILHGVYSTSTGEVYGTNTQRNEEIYVDHHEGACFNGTYYDVREYPWQTECESYAIDERGVNGAAGTEMARVHREFHFYEAGTLDSDNPVEVSFKGVMRFTDLDNHEGYTFDQGLYAAWLNNPTNVERIDELTWKGTWENRNDDVNWEHETLWVEVESSPERPLTFTYWVYNIHGSGINYYGNTITYTLVEDGKDALPPDAKPAVGVHCATYAAYDLMPEDEFLRYQFDGWYYDPQLTQKVPDTIMVSEDHVFYGTYHKVAGLITTEVVNGTITPTDECVPYGADKQIEYAPMEGYLLDTVTIDGQSYDPGEVPSGFTFTNVQEDHYVKVVYAPAEMDKSVSMEESATIENYAGNADIDGQVVRDGDIVSYLISYENPTSVVRTIMITDNVPETVHVVPDSISDNGVLEDGKIIWSVQAEPYSRGEVYFNGIVSEEAEGKIVKNSAVVTLQPIVTDGTENAVTLEDTVETPVLPDPSKSAFSENGIEITNQIVNSGSVVVYQITFENPSDSEKLFTVTDSVPPEVTYLDGTASDGGQYSGGQITWSVNLAPHEIRTVSFQVKVNDPQGAYTHIFNQAEVAVDGTAKTTDSPEHTLEEDPARTPVYVLDSPVKTVLNADGRNIGADSDGNPIQTVKQTGDTLFYQVTFGNPADDTRIFTVTDTIPEGLRLVNATDDAVYDEASRTLTWTLEVSSQTQYTVGIQAEILKEAEGTVLRNHATVNVDQACMDTNEVQTPVLAAPVKDVYSGAGGSSVNAFPVTAGQSLIYTVTWKNPSDMPKTAVITDILPEGVLFLGADQEGVYSEEEHAVVWNVVTEAHSEGTVMVKVEVSETMAGTVLNNRAAVRMDEAEMPSVTVNDGNPEDTAVNYVAAKTVTDSEGNDINGMLTSVGDLITYHIPFQNHSAGTCVYKIQDVLPQGITFVEASGSGNVQSVVHGQTVTWTLEVPAKTAGEVWVTAKVTDSLKGQAFANSAILEVQEPETGRMGKAMTNQVINYVLDDIRKEVLSENGKKNLEGEKVKGGTELLYRVTFQNTAAAEKVFTVTDELPEGVTFVEAGENGTFDETTGLISWEGTLGAGKTGSVSFKVTVNETADCDFIQNTAKVSVDGTEADSNTVKVYVKGDKATDPECTEKEEVKPGPETDPEDIKPAESGKETEKQPEKEMEKKGEEDPPAQTEKPADKHDNDTGNKPEKECPEKPAEQEPDASVTTSDPEKTSSSTGTVTSSAGTPVSTGNTSPSGISTGISDGTKTGQTTPVTGNGSTGSGITAPGTTGTGVTKSGTTGTGFTSTGTAGTIPSGISGTGTTSTGTGSKGTTVPSAVTAGTASGSGITPATVSGITSAAPGKSDGGDLPGVTSVTTDIPRTGDDSNVILWALIAVSCGIAAILITVFAINPGKKEEDDWEA